MTVTERVHAAVEEARKRGEHPTKVFLTLDDGRKLAFELLTGGHHIAHRIQHEGLRNAVHKIAGLEIVWRSAEFKIE
jgi:hypothetical protein